MQRLLCASVLIVLLGAFTVAHAAEPQKDVAWPAEKIVRAIQAAAPDAPLVEPAKRRRVLVYGRVRTHPESVPCCFCAVEVLGKKTGAFEAVSSGDPEVFAPESLKTFDAVVMNNTHERTPMLPSNFDQLGEDAKRAAKAREEVLKRSLLDYVGSGKGVVGIHGATAGIQWQEFLEMLAGRYGGHFTDSVWVKSEEPAHPLCAPLGGRSFEVRDEIYIFREPYAREKVRVLLSLDLDKTPDPGKREDKDYAVSWIRPYGKGRVFYCSLGHTAAAYCVPQVLEHYLAGIQYAVGDLEADATPR
jgi:type 1 glutamine amidotransferase